MKISQSKTPDIRRGISPSRDIRIPAIAGMTKFLWPASTAEPSFVLSIIMHPFDTYGHNFKVFYKNNAFYARFQIKKTFNCAAEAAPTTREAPVVVFQAEHGNQGVGWCGYWLLCPPRFPLPPEPSCFPEPVSALAGVPQEMMARPSPMPSTFTHPVRFREFLVIRFIFELISVLPTALIGRGASPVRSNAGAWERGGSVFRVAKCILPSRWDSGIGLS
jgi:hypothetical protein